MDVGGAQLLKKISFRWRGGGNLLPPKSGVLRGGVRGETSFRCQVSAANGIALGCHVGTVMLSLIRANP